MKWWAYLHTNGSVQVKRYFDERDLSEARESDFVQEVTQPFEALDRFDAITIAHTRLPWDA